jgi:hypothetical protein
MVNNGAPLCNTSINGTTIKANETKFFNVFHQNIRRLRGKANKLIKSFTSILPSYIMPYRTSYESLGTATTKYIFL